MGVFEQKEKCSTNDGGTIKFSHQEGRLLYYKCSKCNNGYILHWDIITNIS